jgi:hypothetical protein
MAFWTQILITTSGGGSITIATPASGNIDGTNKSFGAASKPKIVVLDEGSYRENFGWTWNAGTLTVTTTIPPTYDLYFIS